MDQAAEKTHGRVELDDQYMFVEQVIEVVGSDMV